MANNEMEIYYLAFNDPVPGRVDVLGSSNISALEKCIYKAKQMSAFKSVDASDLILWKLQPLTCDPLDTLVERVKNLGNIADIATPLRTLSAKISDVFPEPPPELHVCIVIQIRTFVPQPDMLTITDDTFQSHPTEKAHKTAVQMAQDAPPPSSVSTSAKKFKTEQEVHPIYNGRPGNRRGPPISIYHPAFAKLKDALQNPSLHEVVDHQEEQRVEDTARLCLAATGIYDSEEGRMEAVYPCLQRLLDVDIQENVAIKGRTKKEYFEVDGVVEEVIDDPSFGEKKGIVAYVEVKNELGLSGQCGVQNALTLRKHLAQEEFDEVRNTTCCPCIIISVAGPYISFGGAVLADIFFVEAFTDYIYIGAQPLANDRVVMLSRIFAAVAEALHTLKLYYRYLRLSQSPVLTRLFPQPTFLDNHKPETLPIFHERFDYRGRDPDNYRRSLFLATYGNKKVLVKFCEQYHGEGHRIVAAAGYAPELFFCEKIRGGVMMVIMESVKAENAFHHFKNLDLPAEILDNVKSAIETLHHANLVFGDLRRPNILIVEGDEGLKGFLIDFEWVGQEHETRYPPFLNDTGEIRWADGVRPHALIRKSHDLEMLGLLKRY